MTLRPRAGCFRVRLVVRTLLSIAVLEGCPATSTAQQATTNPGVWRPLVYADLKAENPDNLTYIDIWKDALSANNRAYDAKGAALPPNENAPASDAHVVIRGPQRTVVLTTLDTEAGCKPADFVKAVGFSVKLCPTRLVIFEGPISKTKDLPASCYLEPKSTAAFDPSAAGSYVAYDTITKTIKLGVVVNHRPIDECSRYIPISEQVEAN
jgi:hypothetical protein